MCIRDRGEWTQSEVLWIMGGLPWEQSSMPKSAIDPSAAGAAAVGSVTDGAADTAPGAAAAAPGPGFVDYPGSPFHLLSLIHI